MIIIDPGKAYDGVPQFIIKDNVEVKGIVLRYIKKIQDMYNRVTVRFQSHVGVTELFSIEVSLHRRLTLSPLMCKFYLRPVVAGRTQGS